MRKYLMPDYMFDRFDEITPAFLKKIGVRGLIIDIDNTLVTYDDVEPPSAVREWFGQLSDAGISAALVSNNTPYRVEAFNKTLRLPAYPDSKKPSVRSLLSAMKAMGTTHEETAMLGDQLLTDVWAAKRLGLCAIVVPPIKDKRTLLFRVKRMIERPYIRRFKKAEHQSKALRKEK
ncbi:MAG: YqeG family HAD IIIA-type phosphatase [Clostridiales bacterium]|nr:YqeG family HAD IIIA-type phosphatase [Clostridiales bacterium]